MPSVHEVIALFRADTHQFTASLDKAAAQTKAVGAETSRTSNIVKGAYLAMGAGAAFFAVKSIKAYSDHQKALTQMQRSFQNNPSLIRANVRSFDDLAKSIADVTGVERDSINAAVAVGARFTTSSRQLREFTQDAVDLSVKMGTDVPTAASKLGLATLGNARALKALGVDTITTNKHLKTLSTQSEKVAYIMGLVEPKVRGTAAAMGKTLSGQVNILKDQFHDLEIAVGSKLVPVLSKLVTWVSHAVEWFGALPRPMRMAIGIGAGLAVAIVGIAKAFNILKGIWFSINVIMAASPWTIVIAGLIVLTVLIIKNWTKIKDFLAAVWGWIKRTGVETWQAVHNGVMSVVGDIIAFLIRAFRSWLGIWIEIGQKILDVAAMAFGWLPGIGSKVKAARDHFHTFTQGVLSDLNEQANRFDRWGTQTTSQLNDTRSAADRVRDATLGISSAVRNIPSYVFTGKASQLYDILTQASHAISKAGFIRLHSGGPAEGMKHPALASDERIAVLQTGEYVVPRNTYRQHKAVIDSLPRFHSGGVLDPTAQRLESFGVPYTGGPRYSITIKLDPAKWGQPHPKGVAGSYSGGDPYEADMRRLFGAQLAAAESIVRSESGFNPTAQNPTSTAYGRWQFLNSTWAGVGGHKTSDPYLQDIYGQRYVNSRYGGANAAWAFHLAHGWYGNGLDAVFSRPTVIGVGERGPERVQVTKAGESGVDMRVTNGLLMDLIDILRGGHGHPLVMNDREVGQALDAVSARQPGVRYPTGRKVGI